MSDEVEFEDEWTALADDSTAGQRHWWWLVLAAVVMLIIAIVWLWPRGSGQPRDPASQDPASLSLGLLAVPGPSDALAAFASDLGITEVSRLLLTPEQIQATGRTAEDDAAWQDMLFVEERAIELGDALLDPAESEAFELATVDGRVLSDLIAQTLSGAGDDARITQVLVRRDPLASGNPVLVEVYWQDASGLHVTRADLDGTVIP
ncbi:hypothetical protein SAMN06309944_1460 [Micrococcales bacterium KH10]|nr:hypothetical protein SAMN06309944_1460 [Micrococcales bacterium KH10]